MTQSKIDAISLDVKNFLARSSKSSIKIKEMEDKLSKMQNHFLRPITSDNVNLEEKSGFNEFIRRGTESDLITKSFSGGGDDGGVLITSTLSRQIVDGIKARSPMRQLAAIDSISTRALDIIIEDGSFGSGWVAET